MGFVDYKVKKTFGKIFKGVAKQLNAEISDIKIGIVFKDAECLFEAYNDKEKDESGACKVHPIKFDDYLGIMDSGSHVISATIGQAGGRYAKEISAKLAKDVAVSDITIILKDNPNEIPHAVLMAFGQKQRMIDIKKEFTQDQPTT